MLMNLRFGFCFGDFLIIILLVSVSCRSLAIVDLENEWTLAIVKPDGISGNYTSSIRKIVLESGFTIQREVTLHLAEDSVRTFYAEHSTKSFFPSLIKYMTSGPVLIMVLEKHNAIADWRSLIGPTDSRKAKITHPDSIRAMCGEDLERNCVHGSDSHESAAREISFFFPDSFPEYVFKAVKAAGVTSIGVQDKDSVCVVTQKKILDKLLDPTSVTHLFPITKFLGLLAPIALIPQLRNQTTKSSILHNEIEGILC